MPISLVQSAVKPLAGAASTTISLPSNVAAGNCVVVFTTSWGASSSSVTDNLGNSYTSLVSGSNAGADPFSRIFAATNVAGGALTATINFLSTIDATIIIAEFSGVALSSPAEGANIAVGTGTSPSVSTNSATTDAGDVIIGVVTHDGATNAITEAGTLIAEQENNTTYQSGNAQYTLPGSTGVQTLTWTTAVSVNWLATVVALKPAGAGSVDQLATIDFMPPWVVDIGDVQAIASWVSGPVVADVTDIPLPSTFASAHLFAVRPETTDDWYGAVSNAGEPALPDDAPVDLVITPAPATAQAAGVDPIAILSNITLSSALATCALVTIAPAVQLGGVTVQPTLASVSTSGVAPSAVQSSIALAPTAAACSIVTVAPAIAQSSVLVAPTPVSASTATQTPAVVMGTITLAPAASSVGSATITPAIQLSSVAVAPASASASAITIAPAVIVSGGLVTVAPAPATCVMVAIAPATVQSGVTLLPQAAAAQGASQAPGVALSSLALQPAGAGVSAVSMLPATTLSTIALTAVATTSASTPLPAVAIDTTHLMLAPFAASCAIETHAPGVAFITPPQHITPASGIGARGGFHVGGRSGTAVSAREGAQVGGRGGIRSGTRGRAGANTGARRRS